MLRKISGEHLIFDYKNRNLGYTDIDPSVIEKNASFLMEDINFLESIICTGNKSQAFNYIRNKQNRRGGIQIKNIADLISCPAAFGGFKKCRGLVLIELYKRGLTFCAPVQKYMTFDIGQLDKYAQRWVSVNGHTMGSHMLDASKQLAIYIKQNKL